MNRYDMTAAQLIALHNSLCPKERQVKDWRASKVKLIERIEALEAARTSKPRRKSIEKTKDQGRGAIGRSVATLLLDARLSYSDILQMVMAAHPHASTTTRSIASVAASMRREGIDVPSRRAGASS